MTTSTNYGLKKPDYNDQYDLADWNYNTDKIDQTMKNISDAVSSETTNRQNAISSEANSRSGADTALGTRIDNIVNGNTTVGSATKASQDGDGNTIKTTYQKSNLVTSWQSTTDNTHYPSEKLVKDSLDGKASSSHSHAVSDVSGLQSTLNLLVSGIESKLGVSYKTKSVTVYGTHDSPTTLTLDAVSSGVFTIFDVTANIYSGSEYGYLKIFLPNGGRYAFLRSWTVNMGDVSNSSFDSASGGSPIFFHDIPSTKMYCFGILRIS